MRWTLTLDLPITEVRSPAATSRKQSKNVRANAQRAVRWKWKLACLWQMPLLHLEWSACTRVDSRAGEFDALTIW
jgi:hypothetical protein